MGTAARLGTGQQPANFGGVGLNTAVAVKDRPVTRQGMGGMRVKTAGPGRQVQDVSFYQGVLRKRVADLVEELGRMRSEMEDRAKSKTTQQSLSRRYDDLITEVRGLEGSLADYNLAQDKTRGGIDPSEIASFGEGLRRRNADEARAIDRIFLDRQEVERGVARLEGQVQEVRDAERARLDSLPPAQRAEFSALLERNADGAAQVDSRRAELAKLNARIAEHDEALQADVYRDECALLQKRLDLVTEAADEAEAEAEAKAGPEEARSRLLAKVRADSDRTKALGVELEAAEEERERLRRLAAELDGDIASRERGGGQEAKYDELFRRDEEMTQFIDRYPELRKKEAAEQARAKETIVALLEHISTGLNREHSMPSQAEHKEMAEELEDKEQELAASRYTEEHLQAELARRRAEFEKVTRIDKDVSAETATLRDRIGVMRAEMAVFEDVDRLRGAAEGTLSDLEARRNAYKQRRDRAKGQLRALAAEYHRKKAMLDSHDVEASLLRAEDKLRTKEGHVQAAKEFVAEKGRHTEFRALKARTLELVAEINERLKEDAGRIVPVGALA